MKTILNIILLCIGVLLIAVGCARQESVSMSTPQSGTAAEARADVAAQQARVADGESAEDATERAGDRLERSTDRIRAESRPDSR